MMEWGCTTLEKGLLQPIRSGSRLLQSKGLDFEHPIQSLDQLYVAAQGMKHVLIRKAQKYAKYSCGLFPANDVQSQGKPILLRWAVVENDPCLTSQIIWCDLKPVDRAIEKVLKAYRGDVSRLVDVCRQTIVFEKLSDLTACLELIRTDVEVSVARCTNR